jgi:hypothetical protein
MYVYPKMIGLMSFDIQLVFESEKDETETKRNNTK